MSKRFSKIALGLMIAGLVLMFTPAAWAADGGEAGATFLTTDGARKLGGAIGAGLVIMGGAAGISRIGASAVAGSTDQTQFSLGASNGGHGHGSTSNGGHGTGRRPDQHCHDHHRGTDRRCDPVRGRGDAARCFLVRVAEQPNGWWQARGNRLGPGVGSSEVFSGESQPVCEVIRP